MLYVCGRRVLPRSSTNSRIGPRTAGAASTGTPEVIVVRTIASPAITAATSAAIIQVRIKDSGLRVLCKAGDGIAGVRRRIRILEAGSPEGVARPAIFVVIVIVPRPTERCPPPTAYSLLHIQRFAPIELVDRPLHKQMGGQAIDNR